MEQLPTPRKIPDNIEDWSDEIEELLSEWGEISMCYSYLHNFSQRKHKNMERYGHMNTGFSAALTH